jgi:hypothetical protein
MPIQYGRPHMNPSLQILNLNHTETFSSYGGVKITIFSEVKLFQFCIHPNYAVPTPELCDFTLHYSDLKITHFSFQLPHNMDSTFYQFHFSNYLIMLPSFRVDRFVRL